MAGQSANPFTDSEEVADNVEGAQRELLKYWSRVSSNRWLIAKMFGVLVCQPNPSSQYPCEPC
jgi:hypothetical protein